MRQKRFRLQRTILPCGNDGVERLDKTVVLEIANMEGRYGIENYLMNMLRNFDFDKVTVHFMSYNPGPFDKEIESYGGEIFRIPPLGASLKIMCTHNKAFKQLLAEHPEIQTVHIHGNTAISCIDARIAKKMGIKKIIVHSHSDGCDNFRSNLLHRIGRMLITCSVTDRVSCSEAASRWMFGSTKKSKVLKNAINVEKYRFSNTIADEIKKEYRLENKLVIGHIGRMEKPKNHSFLLKVFQRVHEAHPETCLMLIGDGTLSADIAREAKELGIEDAIVHIKQSDRVHELLQAMDIFLFPSLWEGLGIVLVEAQAAGLPCITSDVIKDEACITELIEKHTLSEGVDAWARAVWDKLEANRDNERVSDKYIAELRIAGFDEKDAAKVLQDIYVS